ncbi:hypothetical protein [Chitinolyticbacter meiyuanensis]|uniref:hypothetical protein n=1 Tax=Chitinolyticbacter meiyuanensis TaxID=682798 RepID=UPI0011E5D433|nr:hypothetical protein [Chitinolyticbacter meiyuanensis]
MVEVAGSAWSLQHQGGASALAITSSEGECYTLQPWTYAAHLAALRSCVTVSLQGATLDHAGFAEAVLAGSDVPVARQQELAAIALWWASGADEPAVNPAEAGWLDLDGTAARLQPWSEGERGQALAECLIDSDEDGAWFDAVGYLDRMTRATVQELAPPQAIDTLHAAATRRLFDATVALNVVAEEDRALLAAGPVARETALRTLRACRALGWTPSQVWAAPAVEIERLLQLMAVVERPEPAPRASASRKPRLADHPDAFVIQIEDDPS